jgi:hypothetical protein
MRKEIIFVGFLVLALVMTAPVSASWLNSTQSRVGYVGANFPAGPGHTWSSLRNESGNAYHSGTTDTMYIYTSSYTANPNWQAMFRGLVTFDTSSIGPTNEIYSASVTIGSHGTFSEFASSDDLVITYAYPVDPMLYAATDFSRTGTLKLDSQTMPTGTSLTPVTFTLSDLSTINKVGYSVFAIKLESDNDDITPAWPGASKRFGIYQTDYYYINISYGPYITPTPTPTPLPGNATDLSVNILEKYSGASLVNQAVTLTSVYDGTTQTKTSTYGETLHFTVLPNWPYYFTAARAGYANYNETYTIPASPGIYNIYMERVLTPIANHSYAHFSVVDQTNGGLIPNAEIRLSDGQTKLTNSAGYAWFSVNNSEQINYYVSKPSGYWPAYGAMNLTADESILVALQRYTGPTATATMPGWTPVTVPTTGTGVDPVVTLSAQLRQQNVQEGMDVWYTNLPFISQFLFLLFIIGGLGLMAGGTRRN